MLQVTEGMKYNDEHKVVKVITNIICGEMETYEEVDTVYLFPHDRTAILFIGKDTDEGDGHQIKIIFPFYDKIMIARTVNLEVD